MLPKNIDTNKAKEFFEEKLMFTTGPVEVAQAMKEEPTPILVDVRRAEDFAKGHAPGAINLPEGRWETHVGLRKDKINVIYCYSHVCHLAAKAALEFSKHGYPAMEMDGGFKAWQEHNLPTESGSLFGFNEAQSPDRHALH